MGKRKKKKNQAKKSNPVAAPLPKGVVNGPAGTGLLQRMGRYSGWFAEKCVPDPWIYAIILTVVAFVAAVLWTDKSPRQVAEAWQDGLWNPAILKLIAQFSFNLILCAALARTPFVKNNLEKLAAWPKSPRMAIWLVATVSILLGLISWALCIIGGAIFGQEVCRQARLRGIRVHYPLAIAAGYLGMMTFGFGMTSSAPLMVSVKDYKLGELITGPISMERILLTPTSLGILAALLLICPLMLAFMHPNQGIVECELDRGRSQNDLEEGPKSFAEWLETNPLILKVALLLPLSYLIDYYFVKGQRPSIDSMNTLFLALVLLFYRTPKEMLRELAAASQSVWSIVFQFPFYAGLMGIITKTGLSTVVANFFVETSTRASWPAVGIVFQGLCNLFVPSAGGQWLVTGEILVETSYSFEYSAEQAILIEIMGDQLTNMIQPMWALPALAMSGLKARDVLGYTAVVMVVAFFVMAAGLSFFPV